ncbi:MAG TPA: DUF4340 domain-containing protein [Mariprofundaceae bacterium]|nr:DUF4340 domain-containing protein [Mariprofundaceae bacterium]
MKIWAVLLVVVGLAGWTLWMQSRPDSEPQDLPVWPVFKAAEVSDISISGTGMSLTHLQRQGNRWLLVDDHANGEKKHDVAANEEAVNHLLGNLAEMRLVRVVTHHTEHFADLGVDEAAGVHVILRNKQGSSLLDILVGNHGADLISTYVRLQGDNEAVTVNRSLTWQVRRMRKAWQAPPPESPQPSLAPLSAGHSS